MSELREAVEGLRDEWQRLLDVAGIEALDRRSAIRRLTAILDAHPGPCPFCGSPDRSRRGCPVPSDQGERCPTCGKDPSLSAEEANCLNVEVHGKLKRCPECGGADLLFHKLGCSRDPDHPASPSPPVQGDERSACENCGAALQPDWKACLRCFSPAPQPPVQRQERWTIEKGVRGSGEARFGVCDVDGPDTERIEVVPAARLREVCDDLSDAEVELGAALDRERTLREALEWIVETKNSRFECKCEGRHDPDHCMAGSIALDADEKMREIARSALESTTEEERDRRCTCWHHEGERRGWTEDRPCPLHPDNGPTEEERGE